MRKSRSALVVAAAMGLMAGSTFLGGCSDSGEKVGVERNGCGGPNGCGGKQEGKDGKHGCGGPNGCGAKEAGKNG